MAGTLRPVLSKQRQLIARLVPTFLLLGSISEKGCVRGRGNMPDDDHRASMFARDDLGSMALSAVQY